MSQAAVDINAFAEMKEIMGDSFAEIIAMCLQTLPEQNNKLAEAISEQDSDKIFNVAHRLKSACSSIGAFGLAEKAETIEQIGRAGLTDGVEQAYDELQGSLREVISHLENETP